MVDVAGYTTGGEEHGGGADGTEELEGYINEGEL